MQTIKKPAVLSAIAVFVAAVLLCIGLFGVKLGVGANGSLLKTLEHLGLYSMQPIDAASFSETYYLAQKTDGAMQTGDAVYALAMVGKEADSALSVYVPSAIYALLFLAGLFLLLYAGMGNYHWNNVLLCVFGVLLLADFGYAAFFNTPYKEAAIYVYVILTAGLFLFTVKKPNVFSLVLLGITGCLLAGSSPVAAVVDIAIGLFCLRLTILKKEIWWKVLTCLLCVFIVVSGVFALAAPKDGEDLYNSVFYGAAESAEDLKAFGLEDSYASYIGKASFTPEAQKLLASGELDGKLSYAKVTGFYLSHPNRLLSTLTAAAKSSTAVLPDYLGNRAYGTRAERSSYFQLHSFIKQRLLPPQLWFMLVFWILLIAIGLFYKKNYAETASCKIFCETVALGGVLCALTFIATVIVYGMTEISFYLHFYNAVFDICLLAAMVGGSRLLWIRREKLKEKYGVNQ